MVTRTPFKHQIDQIGRFKTSDKDKLIHLRSVNGVIPKSLRTMQTVYPDDVGLGGTVYFVDSYIVTYYQEIGIFDEFVRVE